MTEENIVQSPSDVEKKIIHQVEYYFGDMNLPRDRFLQEEMKKDEGWIPLEVMTKFNRLKLLSTDIQVIATALKKSGGELVEISEDNTKIRRAKSKPLPENRLEFWQQLKFRTLYVKGFPEDSQFEQLMEFFGKYGKVDNLAMRKTKDTKRIFKGSVFVTYANRDLCQAFIDAESVKYGDTELIRLFEADYFKNKIEERKQNKLKKMEEKKAVKEQQYNKKKNGEKSDELSFTSGRVIHLRNLPEKNLDRDLIKTTFGECGEIDWVDFKRGDTTAFVRVSGQTENSAVPVLEKMKEKNNNSENKVKIGEIECEAEILTGEDEKAYYIRTQEEKKAAFERKGAFKKNKQNNKNNRNKDWKNKKNQRRNDEKAENGKSKEEDKPKNDQKMDTESHVKDDKKPDQTENKPKNDEKMGTESRVQADKKPNQTESSKRPAEADASVEPAVKMAKSDE